MGFIIAAAVAAAVIAFCFLCYKKAPPTQAIVVTGFGLSRPKVVCGRGVFVLPIVQRADRLNMRLLKIDVKTPETGVKTKEGVSLWLDSVVTVQVYSENSTVSDEEVRNAGYVLCIKGGVIKVIKCFDKIVDLDGLEGYYIIMYASAVKRSSRSLYRVHGRTAS